MMIYTTPGVWFVSSERQKKDTRMTTNRKQFSERDTQVGTWETRLQLMLGLLGTRVTLVDAGE